MPTSAELLNRLRTYIKSEAETQRTVLERQWSHPLAERVAKGWAIEGLRVERCDKGLIKLVCYTNVSRFREGDLLLLHRGIPQDPNSLHVELQYDGETELEVSIIRGNELILMQYPDRWILDQDWYDVSPFLLDTLDTVADSLRGRTRILPLLEGTLTPQVDFARYERARELLSDSGLNESQIESVAQSYATNLMHMIQGPPGTGKTLMLAYLAKLLVDDGQRVLVTALTHRAIHNALNKIQKVDESLPVCKIGEERHISDLQVPNFDTFTKSHFGDLKDGYIVGATPFAVHSKRLANVEFDTVIFDEASQVTIPLGIMGMMAANTYIFIGDEYQLPPVSIFLEETLTQTSIFSFLSGYGNETLLNITYRLNDELADWPSQTFYKNLLKPSETAAKRRLQLTKQQTKWDFVLDPVSPLVFIDLCHKNSTIRSMTEAESVIELLISLLEHKIPPEEIGVVVPYRAQSRLIRSLLRRIIKDENIWKKIIVDTVDRMQGQEKEIVIFSFTTASPAFASQVADFLLQPQRLNVAVTRPRTKLILVGSHHMLDGNQVDAAHPEAFELLQSLIDNCITFTIPGGSLI